jgi:phosphoglycolate phosphatase
MHKAGHLVLDLDGTISDPAVGILRSLNFALKHFGYSTIEDGEVARYIGPPIDESIRSIIGPSPPRRVEQLVSKYRERYADIGYSENVLYDGVPEALEGLASAGTSLGVCTSKRVDFAERILGLFRLRQYFKFVSGGDIGVHKTQQLAALLGAGDISPNSMMVGDRAVDIVAAKKNHLRSAGVLWGHGTVAELSSAGPDRLLEQPRQLVELAHAV